MTNQDDSTHEVLFKELAAAIEEHLEQQIPEEDVRRIAAEEIAKVRLPRPVKVEVNGQQTNTGNIIEGRVHHRFDELMKLIDEGQRNILMVGPAGSGKTTLAEQVATGLGLEFGFLSLSAGVTETHLFGRILPQADGTWAHQPTRFLGLYEEGGVFLFDEVDAADPNLMVSINAAIANGQLANPVTGQVHVRSPQFYLLAAANTYGHGGDVQYVGRNQLDAATLDRFILATIEVGYDEALEEDLARSIGCNGSTDQLLSWVKTLRARIDESRVRRIASTRLVVSAARALTKGRSLADVQSRYFLGWSTDERAKVEV